VLPDWKHAKSCFRALHYFVFSKLSYSSYFVNLCFLQPNNRGMELTVMQWWLGSLATASAPPSPPGPLADVTPVVDAVVSSDVQLRAHEAEDHSKNILCK
jgi:hypothetical protein